MKHVFYLFFLLFITESVLAQTTLPTDGVSTVQGTVADTTDNKPVAFATVALLTTDGKVEVGTTTDDKGTFFLTNVKIGMYQLRISLVGYQSKTIPAVRVQADTPTLALGRFLLRPVTKTLSEVNVVGQKALVEDKGDRLVYNAESDISNAGGTAADVLRKVPMLSVDLDGNVKMRGSSNIKVLVNGKPSSIMARNLADALKQMPANVIKSVEVITSPGAKYDAEGSGGVINIITKKALKGTNGTANATVGNLSRQLGLNLNIKGNKVGFATSLNGYQFRNINETSSSRTSLVEGQPTSVLFQQSNRDNTGTGGYGNLSLDYDPDSLNRINFSANAWGGNFPNNSQLSSRLTDPQGNTLQDFKRVIQFNNPYGNSEFNLGWTRTLKRPGQELSLLSQFSRMPDNYYYTLVQTPINSELPTYREASRNLSQNKEYTLQLDYTHPFKIQTKKDTATLKLDMGAKTIKRDIVSLYSVQTDSTGRGDAYEVDVSRSNDFTYNQQVTSGYASVKLETKQKWNLTLGSRLEHTRIQGNFRSSQSSFANAYNNFIPSFTLAKTLREKHTIKLSYTQRISRPMVWYLNPNRNSSDSKNIQTGNPYLKPELTHATELSYSTFGKSGSSLNTALFWRQTNNSIEFLTTVDAQGVAFSTFQNIGRNASYGLNLNGTLQPNKSLNITLGVDLSYVNLLSVALNQQNSGWVSSLNTNISYKLPKALTLQANGYVSSGTVMLQGSNTGWYYYGLSAKRDFWDKNASLTLGINNPFSRSVKITSEQAAPTFRAQSTSFITSRFGQLTFSYKFGKMSDSGRQSKKISNDDSKGGSR